MLVSLQVRNLALVDAVDVDFGPGLNVITGETGAGKSVLVGALGLLLGSRADRELIRGGETECGAEAVFALPDGHAVHAILEELELPACDDGALVIRRVIKADGPGRNLVNDASLTLQSLKRLGQALVDMHGPHDHQSLLDPGFQRDLLDAYGRHPGELSSYREAYDAYGEVVKRKQALEGPVEGLAEQMDLLSFRVKELEDAALDPVEEEAVRQEHQVLGNAQEIQALGGGTVQALMDGEGAAFDAMAVVQRNLEELARLMPDAEPWRDEAQAIAVQIQELHRAIAGELEGLESDPGRMQWLDERLTVYQKMLRKYGPAVDDALTTLETSRTRLADLSSRDERLAELERELKTRLDAVCAAGAGLTAARKKAAKKLAAAITGSLRRLGFAKGEFSVDVAGDEPGPHGADAVEYGFAPNVGEAMRPLRAIASSGEISRVMLASKRVLASLDRIPVLVFDEIDANIGGEIATVVGQQLADLAGHHQVLCITHLPQVAVYGKGHYAVSKTESKGRTTTRIDKVSDGDRAEEIARMLGGKDLTTVTLDHAREMLAGVTQARSRLP